MASRFLIAFGIAAAILFAGFLLADGVAMAWVAYETGGSK